jgi:RNA methyltransferase, TrmH family
VTLLSTARDLRRRLARQRRGLFVAEGARTVQQLLTSTLDTVGILVDADHAAAPRIAPLLDLADDRGLAVQLVTPDEFASAAETESPQGILAVAAIPTRSLADLALVPTARILLLDGLQDPGNAGTMVRTAAALGAQATVALPGTVDLWNAKVVRGAMGALFDHPAFADTWSALDLFRQRADLPIWAADAGGPDVSLLAPPARLGLIIGNEGAGLSDEGRARAEQLVAIPIDPAVESLNAAVAAGILLYQLRR